MSQLIAVNVGTATVIPASALNPNLVLVGRSKKHQDKLVLPGGKVEIRLDGTIEDEEECALRELEEETGLVFTDVQKIGKAIDPQRDVRVVPFGKISSALIEPPLSELIVHHAFNPEGNIEAHYGTPDTLFLGYYQGYIPTDEDLELKDRFEFNIYDLKPDLFGAGHDVIILWYRWLLQTGAEALPADALINFDDDRRNLMHRFGL